MKKASFKKLVVLFSLAATCLYGIALACADFIIEYDRDSSFAPETYVDESYSPLFFSPYEPFYNIGYETNYISRFNDAIVTDWSTYLEGKMTTEEVTYFLLEDEAGTVINKLYDEIQKKQKLTAPYSHLNGNDAKVKGFIEFMYYARAIEVASKTLAGSWEPQDVVHVDAKTIGQVEKRFTETRDPFLKSRYWFQTMKAYFYSANKQSVVLFFEKTKASVPQDVLYYRGVSYVAGSYYAKKQYDVSNYLYSTVFDKCPQLLTVAAYNFHPQEQQDFDKSLALAKSNEERSALWALLGYYADEKKAIQEIYKLDPKSRHLDYLLTRLVNKEESSINSSVPNDMSKYRESTKNLSSSEALQLVTTIAREGKTAKPWLWNSAAGYLNIFAGNAKLTNGFFAKAEGQSPKSELAVGQMRVLKLINTLFNTVKMDAAAENKLLPELSWLYGKLNVDNHFRYQHAKEWSKRYISSLYKNQGNTVMAELFSSDSKFYQNDANVDAMKNFMEKTSKTPWEKFAYNMYEVTLPDIYEYQAVMSAYAGNFDKAISLMEQSNGKSNELLGNPFNGKIKDCHDCDHAASQKIKYTKLGFLQKMKEIESTLASGTDVYNNALLLANAYYNMTYHGNARAFYYGTIFGKNTSDTFIDPFYTPQLLSCSTPKKYYEMALAAAATDEQKAKCTYLLAKCERNEYYNANPNPEADFLAWNGFKKLKSEYSNAKYYQEVIKECGYFKKYVEGK